MGTPLGNLQNLVAGRPADQIMKSQTDVYRDVSETCFFLNSTLNNIKLTLKC